MKLTQAKLFIKSRPSARRDYFVLLLRQLLARDGFLLFLHYDGTSSKKLNALRYLALNHGVAVHLLLRRWLSSVFRLQGSSLAPLQCRTLVLHSEHQEAFRGFLGDSSLVALLDDFPFLGLSHRGLFSQEPFFSLLSQSNPGSLQLLQLLRFLVTWLRPLCAFGQSILLALLRLLMLRS